MDDENEESNSSDESSNPVSQSSDKADKDPESQPEQPSTAETMQGDVRQSISDMDRRITAIGEALANVNKLITTMVHNGSTSQGGPASEQSKDGINEDGSKIKTSFYDLDV